MNNDTKWWPYRFACMWLYGSIPGIQNPAAGFIIILMPEFCSYTKLPNSRVREYVRECERLGMISGVSVTKGLISFKIVKPEVI